MSFCVVLILAFIVSSVYVFKRGTKPGVTDLILKIAASVMFVAVGVSAVANNPADLGYGLLIVFGAVFGLIGDAFIELKWVYSKDMKIHLNCGFIFFMLQHICIIFGVVCCAPISLFSVSGVLCILIPLSILGITVLGKKKVGLDFGEFKVISYVYTVVAATTCCVSCVSMLNGFELSQIILFVGAVLFLMSDMVLSLIFFTKDNNKKSLTVVNHALYYLAQLCIASSLYFLG